jgi:hypothetical protein
LFILLLALWQGLGGTHILGLDLLVDLMISGRQMQLCVGTSSRDDGGPGSGASITNSKDASRVTVINIKARTEELAVDWFENLQIQLNRFKRLGSQQPHLHDHQHLQSLVEGPALDPSKLCSESERLRLIAYYSSMHLTTEELKAGVVWLRHNGLGDLVNEIAERRLAQREQLGQPPSPKKQCSSSRQKDHQHQHRRSA